MMRVEDGAAGKPATAMSLGDTLVYAVRKAMEGQPEADAAIKIGVKKARDIETHKGEALDLIWGAGVMTGYYMAFSQMTAVIDEVLKEAGA
jgi:hypothetical protein